MYNSQRINLRLFKGCPHYAGLGVQTFKMKYLLRNSHIAVATSTRIFTLVLLLAIPAISQAPAYKAPRTADGKPNLNGIWEAMNTANWDIQPHSAAPGMLWQAGAAGAEPAGIGVVEGGEIPYLPAATAKKKANFANRLALDPETKCYLPGVPRATYMPFPFQIIQSAKVIMINYEYDGAARLIYVDGKKEAPVDSWMGYSNARWEGDTLVVDVTGLNEDSWFDRAGDFHSNKLHVVERYTPRSPDTVMYEATIEDPLTFSRPWKISMPLYRHVEKDAKLLEFKCVPFSEELLYGKFRKKPANGTK
jgi:hypothetical protein